MSIININILYFNSLKEKDNDGDDGDDGDDDDDDIEVR